MIFVNFKTYRQGTGRAALKLVNICSKVALKASLTVIPLAQVADILRFSKAGLDIWAQHADDVEYGANTGRVLPEALVAAGAKGVIINHSEDRLPAATVNSLVSRCRRLGLKTLVCAASVQEGKRLVSSKPDYFAYEPPALIGSRTDSVASAKPEVIKDFVNEFRQLPVLVGAGVHSREDVKISLKLGARGILVATDVVLADDPKARLFDLANGFRS